jgi:RNA polymerase sigma-70 factor (ECF subfamily)
MAEFPETRPSLLAHVRSPENHAAWEEFVLAYRPVIYRMARRRGMQDADAQDIVQTVLTRVAGAIGRWEKKDPGSRFRHWLRRVAKNAILNELSRPPRDPALGDSGVRDLLAAAPAASLDVEKEIELEYMREQYLRAAVVVRTVVDARTWQAFELTVIDGSSCENAAALLGTSVGAVYAARSRVMRRLRDQVRSLEDDER